MSFNVYFSANGNILGSLPGNKEMIVYELFCKFYQVCSLEEKDKVTFTFKSKELKLTSCKTLQEAEIVDGSNIEDKTKKTLKKFENPGNEGNSQVPQNNLSGMGKILKFHRIIFLEMEILKFHRIIFLEMGEILKFHRIIFLEMGKILKFQRIIFHS